MINSVGPVSIYIFLSTRWAGKWLRQRLQPTSPYLTFASPPCTRKGWFLSGLWLFGVIVRKKLIQIKVHRYHWSYYCKADLFWYMMWIIHQLRVWDRMQVWFAESDDRASGLGLSDPSLRRLPFALVDWLGSLFSVLPGVNLQERVIEMSPTSTRINIRIDRIYLFDS